MTSATIFLIVIMFVGVSVSLFLSVYSWKRRDKTGVAAFSVLMFFVAFSAAANGAYSLAATAAGSLFWFYLSFLGVAVIPVAFFVFIVRYTGRAKWLDRTRIALLLVIPAITQVMIWTNESHHLFMRTVTIERVNGLYQILQMNGGWYFFVHTTYSYGLLAFGLLLALVTVFRSRDLYRRQAIFLLLGAIPSITFSVVRTFDLIPGTPSIIAPLGYTIAGLIFSWDLFRYRLLDIIPVARDTLIDSMTDGMLVLDDRDRVVDLNPAMRALLGTAAGTLVGQPVETALSNRPGWLEHFGITDGHAEIVTQQDGETRYHDLRVSPLRDRRGHVTGRLILLRDLTARKQAEQALQQSNQELQARNEELDTFSHTVAHDLKNPLNSIVLYSGMLESEFGKMPKAQVLEKLKVITRNGLKMGTIIDELLLLARMHKEEQLRLEPVNMEDLLADMRARLASLIAETGAVIQMPETWPAALGRAQWVEEVWVNYISNAIKYGGRPPRLELGADERPDGMVRFWVRDNGNGLTPEDQSRLFVPFTRLGQAQLKGHGLGLSIVKRIVEKMGGTVGLESDGLPGRGCTFSFTLPKTG